MNVAGLVFTDDLLFASRITGFARDHGSKVRIIRDGQLLVTAIGQERPKCIFFDLQFVAVIDPKIIATLAGLPQRPLLIGFGSHVDVDSLQSAREAGCDLVMPRSAFVARLPTELRFWLDGQLTATQPF